MSVKGDVVLENSLDLRQVLTTGSILQINEDYCDENIATESEHTNNVDFIGKPINCFKDLEKKMEPVNGNVYIMKKIIEEGGGMPLTCGNTVSIAFSGYWEKDQEPFDVQPLNKLLEVDLQDNGLLPGLQIAVYSMLVGEMSVFLLSHQLMYKELGIPPRIKPKATCAFYIKLVKSIITPKGALNLSEPNIFDKVYKEVKGLYASGVQLHKVKNYGSAIKLFRKGVFMLHRVRLADESEEKIQEKMLIKLYTNLAICYNKNKAPLRACVACNEVNRLSNIWNNGKLLFQNAKALRMIGDFENAEKRLCRSMKLCPNQEEIKMEYERLQKTKESCSQTRLLQQRAQAESQALLSPGFKQEVENLIKNFKQNEDLLKLTLPGGLNTDELNFVKELCIRENIFCTRTQQNFALDKDQERSQADVTQEFEDLLLR